VRIAHIVNPFIAPPGSLARDAQVLTFESLRIAREFAEPGVTLIPLAAAYAEDQDAVPDDWHATTPLTRSVLDFESFRHPRKLPRLADVLDRASSVRADWVIYSNTDIAVQPYFYTAVAGLLDDGADALVINRRTLSDEHREPSKLPLLWSQLGEDHPGYDCFVFPREWLPRLMLEDVCIGAPGVGLALTLNLLALAERFRLATDLALTFHLGDDKPWNDPRFADLSRFNRGQLDRVIARLHPRLGAVDSVLPRWDVNYVRQRTPAPGD
jgi:hypothetical protein